MNAKLTTNARNSLRLLIEGNRRFGGGLRSIESFTSPMKIKEFAEKGQHPFAVVLTCSDSRIPAEILFDRGIGDLFVVRVAGNTADTNVIASIEYAVENLGSPLCVVMGHSGCGAIQAAFQNRSTFRKLRSRHLRALISRILPALRGMTHETRQDPDRLVEMAVLENVRNTITTLRTESEVIRRLENAGKLSLVGAKYELFTGVVHFDVTPDPALIEVAHA